MLLVLILTGPVMLLWLAMSRVSRLRSAVAVILAAQAAAGCLLAHRLPRGVLEISLSAVVLALLTVGVARSIERRRLGPGRQTRVVVATHLLAGWSVVALIVWAMVWRPGPFVPAADGVLPLPRGLSATVHPYDDGSCGSGSCTRTITVTGRAGQSGDDLRAEVTRHLEARGWGRGCRPGGWLLDRSEACAEVAGRGGQVDIRLSGHRDGDRSAAMA